MEATAVVRVRVGVRRLPSARRKPFLLRFMVKLLLAFGALQIRVVNRRVVWPLAFQYEAVFPIKLYFFVAVWAIEKETLLGGV
jgi:hypothetical protein